MPKKIDLTGKRFGRLTVIKEVEPENKRNDVTYWLCKCDCGNQKVVRMDQLRNGRTKSCGCLQKERSSLSSLKDLTDKKFDYLTVIKRADKVEGKKNTRNALWECKCKCGNTVIVPGHHLVSGAVKSCGCLLKETGKKTQTYLEENYRIDGVRTPSLRKKTYKNNRSGHKGIYIVANKNKIKYVARIGIKNKIIHLGTFDTLEKAIEARKRAEEKYFKPILEKEKLTRRKKKMETTVKVMYENILVGEVYTNRSLSVDEALDLIGFDEAKFIEENGFDDIDYNDFRLVY